VIRIIRESADTDVARERLMERFDFSEVQANAILAMRLRRLTGLEREELQQEYRELIEEIQRLETILSSQRTILAEVRKEILAVKEQFGDPRRTELAGDDGELDVEDLIADETMVVTVSNGGYIKRLPVATYRKQRRGGQGVTGMDTKDEDFVSDVFIASAHEYMLFFTSRGRLYWRKVHELPAASRTSKGRAMVNFLKLEKEERVTAFLPVRDLAEEGKFVFMVTRQGTVKKTALKAFSNPRNLGIIALGLDKGDELIDVQITGGQDNILIATHAGKAIRFPESDVRPMGRTARGVNGIKLVDGDFVVGVSLAQDDRTVLSVTARGYGKRTKVGEYRLQHRGGTGIININADDDRNGKVVAMFTVEDHDELVLVATDGKVNRISVAGIRVIGRNTKGVTVMKLREGARVSAVARAVPEEKEDAVVEADAGAEAPEAPQTTAADDLEDSDDEA